MAAKINRTDHVENKKNFPVIGIGASTGGRHSQDATEHWIMLAIEEIPPKKP